MNALVDTSERKKDSEVMNYVKGFNNKQNSEQKLLTSVCGIENFKLNGLNILMRALATGGTAAANPDRTTWCCLFCRGRLCE